MKSLFVAHLTLLVLSVLTGAESREFNCEEAKRSLFPCLGYLIGGDGGKPSIACCNGIHAVQSSTPTRESRHAACVCLREAGTHFPKVREDLATSLPKLCGLGNVGIVVGRKINCNDIP